VSLRSAQDPEYNQDQRLAEFPFTPPLEPGQSWASEYIEVKVHFSFINKHECGQVMLNYSYVNNVYLLFPFENNYCVF
jgi:hypothetical protein